ncbi:39S ribosomal protein L10, mitochondrial [Chionoecetes opilio]|uniref:Large ribosomal subunit protein uL10m n=1 Tax=Chionoecetes opilio TaxID=41210 RepID=A0A8J4XYC0_CHIOP|nr:39S ribosomal protein L10, mitochondrial [Chionoecetes opilio]
MSATLVRRLLPVWSPVITLVRTRTRTINIKKPAIPHWSRAVVLKLTKPIYEDPEEGIHPRESCRKRINAMQKQTKEASQSAMRSSTEVNPFEQILANEYREMIENAKLVAVFHKLPITEKELFVARLQLNKISLKYMRHNNTIMRLAFTGTKYEALLKLYESNTCTFIGDDPAVAKCPRFYSHRVVLRSHLLTLNVATCDLPTLLVAAGVHPSRQHAVIRLSCAFLRKPGQLQHL